MVRSVLAALGFIALRESAAASVVGNWTLQNTQRLCFDSGAACIYNLVILENNYAVNGTGNGTKSKQACHFSVDNRPGAWANQTSFYGLKCSQSDEYAISGGWDPKGFITITVLNLDENYDAFFGFGDSDLAHANLVGAVTRPAYVVGTFGASVTFTHPSRRAVDEAEDVKMARTTAVQNSAEELGKWDVLHLVRTYNTTTGSGIMFFVISDAANHDFPCLLSTQATPSWSARESSFYDIACSASDFRVSWGYKPDTDGAVMTLCGPDKNSMSFFGWNNIGNKSELGSAGPISVTQGRCTS